MGAGSVGSEDIPLDAFCNGGSDLGSGGFIVSAKGLVALGASVRAGSWGVECECELVVSIIFSSPPVSFGDASGFWLLAFALEVLSGVVAGGLSSVFPISGRYFKVL